MEMKGFNMQISYISRLNVMRLIETFSVRKFFSFRWPNLKNLPEGSPLAQDKRLLIYPRTCKPISDGWISKKSSRLRNVRDTLQK